MRSILLSVVLPLTISTSVFAQSQVIKVPLKIENGKKSFAFTWSKELAFDKQQLVTKIQTGEFMKIERSTEKENLFIVTIDKISQNKFSKDEKFEIGIDDNKTFTRQIVFKSGKSAFREFEFTSKRDQDKKVDYFYIRANYSAIGIFRVKTCKIPLSLVDLISDGDFTTDVTAGSNLGIDRNNDGKFWGVGEWLFSDMIVDLCGKNYLISNIAQDGSSLSLKRTNLQNVKLYQKSPDFNFTLVNDKNFSSASLKGKPYLIDFWATWCGICITKMPEIKELEGKLPIIFFNTDTIKRKPDALKLIDKMNIKEISVLRFSPNADNFYKSYQRFYLGLPFYVLIDGEGRFRYGGNGGEDLKELKSELKKLGIN